MSVGNQPRNPLHGLTLEAILTALVAHYGWPDLAERIPERPEHQVEPRLPAPHAVGAREGRGPLPFHAARAAPQRLTMLKYLAGYSPTLLAQVRELIAEGRLAETVSRRYPEGHEVNTDRALYDYVGELKSRFLRSAPPLAKVQYDQKLHIVRNALGTHTTVSRVQGNRLKAKREIRVASLFKQAPAPFLKMIVVHELAHLKEREHDKAFYALCTHMEPEYHQLELDVRLWLTALELESKAAAGR